MASKGTRASNFRLGAETEHQLEQIAGSRGISRTEVLRTLIADSYAGLSQESAAPSEEVDETQMLLDELLSQPVQSPEKSEE